MDEELTTEQVRERLRALCVQAGSIRAWADAHEVSPAYVSDVLNGLRQPGLKLLRVLGLERTVLRIVTYRDAGTGPGRAKEGKGDV